MTLPFKAYQLPETTRRNLFPNPSIETGIGSWVDPPNFTISRSDTQKYFGDYSLLADCNGGGWDINIYTERLAISPESTYSFSLYLRPNVNVTLRLEAHWYRTDNDGTFISITSATNTDCVANTWQRLTLTTSAPVNAYFVFLQVQIVGYFYFHDYLHIDGVMVEESARVGDYFDGSYHPTYADPIEDETSAWDGTAHASASQFTYRTRSEITRIQELNLMTGRRSIADLNATGTCGFEVFDPESVPDMGTLIEVYYDTFLLWCGRVADSETVYGIADNTDTLKVSCEGYLGSAGRAEITVTSKTGVDLMTLASDACSSSGLNAETVPATAMTASHNAYQGNLLSYLQRLQATGYGRLKEGRESLTLIAKDVIPCPQRGGGFTDETPASDESVYSDLRFASRADTFYDAVRVETDLDQVGTDGDGAQTLVVSSFSPTTTEANSLAGYILDLYSTSSLGPSQITIVSNGQTNDQWAQILDINPIVGEPDGSGGPVYQRQQVTFRGETHTMIIEGAQLAATPDICRVTFFLSNADYPYLILDDAAYGQLGFGRLG